MAIRRVPREFATAIRAARLIRGLTQGQVATAAGLPTWRLASFERGQAVPEPAEFAAIWGFLTTADAPADQGAEPR